MNFKLNLHKIAIKVQNGNRETKQGKNHFWGKNIKSAIMEKIPLEDFMNKISFKKLIKVFTLRTRQKGNFVVPLLSVKKAPPSSFFAPRREEAGS